MSMKLSEWARLRGVSYKTAWRYWRDGKLDGDRLPSGMVVVKMDSGRPHKVVVYARVSSSENRDNLDSQAQRMVDYCTARGYQVADVIKEVGSGVNDSRRLLTKLLRRKDFNKLVVEHKDRLTRFGFNYLSILWEEQGVEVEVVNEAKDDRDDLMQDFVSIITSFCARLYGLRRSRRKTEKLIEQLTHDKKA